MNDGKPANVLGVLVHIVDLEMATDQTIAAARESRPFGVSALAVHGLMTGVLDREHRWRLNRLDMVVPDGQPVRWALNWLHGAGLRERVYGPDLMLTLCARAAEERLPVFLYGSREDVLEDLSRSLTDRFPKLVLAGSRPSLFRTATPDERRLICSEIVRSGARLVFVGLGCPRQEVWAYEQREQLPMPLIAVGAAFDFHAGRVRQAPPVLQKRGLEWLFRLSQEPRRLWRRYLLFNPLYLALLLAQAVGLARFDPAAAVRPTSDRGFA